MEFSESATAAEAFQESSPKNSMGHFKGLMKNKHQTLRMLMVENLNALIPTRKRDYSFNSH